MDSRPKILVVDDSKMFQELCATFLARSGRVLIAADGREALEIARRERPDVIIADISMPVMSGDELCQEIRRDPDLKSTPVLMMTSGEGAAERERAVRAGADDVISKPLNRNFLVQVVNRFLYKSVARGLTRVEVGAPVTIQFDDEPTEGCLRNLSRGGAFVEVNRWVSLESEVSIHFALPETEEKVSSTAKVVWIRRRQGPAPGGMGLQFLALDRRASRSIEAFVYERTPSPRAGGIPAAAAR